MSQTTLPVSDRYMPKGTNVIKWLPAVAAYANGPSRVEITAGVELRDEIAAMTGWDTSPSYINTPDAGHRVVSRIPGEINLGDASITFYADRKGQDIRKVLAKGDKGYLWFADGGDVAGSLADLFAVEVAGISKVRTVGSEAFQLTISFAITREPREDLVIPATV